MSPSAWEDRVLIVRRHFERKGYRVHSGLQFGCELVLYADTPDKVHSDFAVHVVPPGMNIIWGVLRCDVVYFCLAPCFFIANFCKCISLVTRLILGFAC